MTEIPIGIWLFIGINGALFAFKALCGLSIALVLPLTQGALYVSTPRARVGAALDAIERHPHQLLVDLGCGGGRILRSACRRCAVRAERCELNLRAFLKAQILCIGYGGITLHLKNFWREDLSGADVVFCYLFPDVLSDLTRKLRSELRSGTTIVSFNFPLPGLAPERVLRPGSRRQDPIFIYRVPPSIGQV